MFPSFVWRNWLVSNNYWIEDKLVFYCKRARRFNCSYLKAIFKSYWECLAVIEFLSRLRWWLHQQIPNACLILAFLPRTTRQTGLVNRVLASSRKWTGKSGLFLRKTVLFSAGLSNALFESILKSWWIKSLPRPRPYQLPCRPDCIPCAGQVPTWRPSKCNFKIVFFWDIKVISHTAHLPPSRETSFRLKLKIIKGSESSVQALAWM